MTEIQKPTDDPYGLLGDNWPSESEDAYTDASTDLTATTTTSTEGAIQSGKDSTDIGETYIGQTGRAASESLGGLSKELDGIATDSRTASATLYSLGQSVRATKKAIRTLVRQGTRQIRETEDAEKNDEELPYGKSSSELTTEFQQSISTEAQTLTTTMDTATASLSGIPGGENYAPDYVPSTQNPTTQQNTVSPEWVQNFQQETGVELAVPPQPSMPAAVPEGTPSPTVPKAPSLPGNPFAPQAPQTPSTPSMPTSPTAPNAEVPSTPTAPAGTESPTTSSPENPTTGNPTAQSQQDAQTPAPSPASLADYAGSAATNAADLATSGITGLTSAATDSVAPVVAGIAPTIAQGAPGSPIAPTGLTPGTPMAPVGLGGMPPAAQAPTPTAAPVAGTVPAPAPAPGQGVVAQPPGVPGSPPAPGQGLVTSAWLHDRYGTPLPASEKADLIPGFLAAMPEETRFLHRLLASLRHSVTEAGWDGSLAVAQAYRGEEKVIVFSTADGVSHHPAGAFLPDGLTPLSDLLDFEVYRPLMGSLSVVDKVRLVTADGWQVGQIVATHGREAEFVQLQTSEQYVDIVDSQSLLPLVIGRGVPDADQQTAMNGFALTSVGLKIPPSDPSILAGQIISLRWAVGQSTEYLDTYRQLLVSEGFAAMSREDWQDSAWAFSQVLSVSPVIEGAVK